MRETLLILETLVTRGGVALDWTTGRGDHGRAREVRMVRETLGSSVVFSLEIMGGLLRSAWVVSRHHLQFLVQRCFLMLDGLTWLHSL